MYLREPKSFHKHSLEKQCALKTLVCIEKILVDTPPHILEETVNSCTWKLQCGYSDNIVYCFILLCLSISFPPNNSCSWSNQKVACISKILSVRIDGYAVHYKPKWFEDKLSHQCVIPISQLLSPLHLQELHCSLQKGVKEIATLAGNGTYHWQHSPLSRLTQEKVMWAFHRNNKEEAEDLGTNNLGFQLERASFLSFFKFFWAGKICIA